MKSLSIWIIIALFVIFKSKLIDNRYFSILTFLSFEISIHNKHLYHIFNTIKVDIKQYGKDILNQFYSEFCIWDRNNDGKLGIVLTPDDIVDLMVNESFKDIDINPHLISLIMNHLLTGKYSYTNGLSINKLMNEIIKIPIFEWFI